MSAIAEHTHIVLVEPSESMNVGSVARAMKNLGFVHLHLVAPERFDLKRAKMTACSAEEILESLTVHADLESVCAPMEEVIGFSAREGKNRSPLSLFDWAKEANDSPATKRALLFGPEDHGLTLEHLEHCRHTVQIPTAGTYTSFNLAHAVLLSLFELFRGMRGDEVVSSRELPTWNEFYQLDRLVDLAMEKSQFVRKGTPEPVPSVVKNLMKRTDPDKREMSILLGLFARLERSIKES